MFVFRMQRTLGVPKYLIQIYLCVVCFRYALSEYSKICIRSKKY